MELLRQTYNTDYKYFIPQGFSSKAPEGRIFVEI